MQKTFQSVEEISARLCEEFKRIVPLKPVRKSGKKPAEQDVRRNTETSLQRFFEAARVERRRSNLGILGRARVVFSLQQRLLGEGYPAPLVKQVLFAMLTRVFIGSGK